MHTKLLGFALILLMQACRPLSAQTQTPAEKDSPGILQRLAERARQTKSTVSAFGETALGFLGAYYEDHIQPVTDSYVGWASDVSSSMWQRIQTTMDNYMPFKATTATDQNTQK